MNENKSSTPATLASPSEAPTIRSIQAINQARSDRWMAGSPGWTILEVAGELCGEAGELTNICKKLRRLEMGVPGNKLSDVGLREQARGECGDVMVVLMLVASKLGIDLEDAVREAFNRKSIEMGFPERIPERCATATLLRSEVTDEDAEQIMHEPEVFTAWAHYDNAPIPSRGDAIKLVVAILRAAKGSTQSQASSEKSACALCEAGDVPSGNGYHSIYTHTDERGVKRYRGERCAKSTGYAHDSGPSPTEQQATDEMRDTPGELEHRDG